MLSQKAVRVIYDMSEDTKIREAARLREKALHDEASLLAGAREEGIEIGREEGIEIGREKGIEIGREEGIEIGREKGAEKERRETIAKMRAAGFTDEQINSIYGK